MEAGAAFTLPFLDTQARFQVIPGNPKGFDPSYVEGKSIGMRVYIWIPIHIQTDLHLWLIHTELEKNWDRDRDRDRDQYYMVVFTLQGEWDQEQGP